MSIQLIIIFILLTAIFVQSFIIRNLLNSLEAARSRYTQLYEQTDNLATDASPVVDGEIYDPDDYTDLTSHQIKRIGERS